MRHLYLSQHTEYTSDTQITMFSYYCTQLWYDLITQLAVKLTGLSLAQRILPVEVMF